MIGSVGALAAGGLTGVFCRAGVYALAGHGARGTMAVNLAGCLLAGFFDAAASRRGFGGPNGGLLLLTGFCGAFTTFSALILELDTLLRASPLRAAAYVVLSVLAGLALFRLGARLGGA